MREDPVLAPGAPAGRVELFKLFLAERDDPEPFYTRLADRCAADFPFALRDRVVLDLGAGPGHYTAALQRVGAEVVPIDLRDENMRRAQRAGLAAVRTDATRLPFPPSAFDGVFCSNMLEHVADPFAVIDEMERVLKPGGWGWISWTNWWSLWAGGHDMTPFHLLGPSLGPKVHDWVRGSWRLKNQVYAGLWPTYVGRVLADLRSRPGLRVLDACPRYYPSQRWVLHVPALREIATWNCLILVEKVPGAPRGVANPGARA